MGGWRLVGLRQDFGNILFPFAFGGQALAILALNAAVSAGEKVVSASELIAAMKQMKEIQRLLGKKTMEVELIKEAVELRSRKKMDSARALAARGYGLIPHQPLS